jgi:8-oxo-dGTP diphosphatase
VDSARHLGEFLAPSANEPGFQVRAALYAVDVEGAIAPRAEIEDVVWVDPARAHELTLAPLTRDHVLPLARAHAIGARLNVIGCGPQAGG